MEWNNMNTVTITKDEYKALLESFANVQAFARFVNNYKYYIDREVCGALLGFKVGSEGAGNNAEN